MAGSAERGFTSQAALVHCECPANSFRLWLFLLRVKLSCFVCAHILKSADIISKLHATGCLYTNITRCQARQWIDHLHGNSISIAVFKGSFPGR
jgi:hypothetical protein